MSRIESTLVGVFIGFVGLLLPFVFCWWIAAAWSMSHPLSLSEGTVAVAALVGLGSGIVLDILYLKKWVQKFYNANGFLLVLVYLALSVIALAFFMGTPPGNLALGMLAGLYIGRRYIHERRNADDFARAAQRVSIFTACVTSIESFPIGILALREGSIIGLLRIILGINLSAVAVPGQLAIIAAVCVVLFALQFWFTRTMARFAFKLDECVG